MVANNYNIYVCMCIYIQSFNGNEDETFNSSFDIGSLSKHYEYNPFVPDEDTESEKEDLPRLVLMGLRG